MTCPTCGGARFFDDGRCATCEVATVAGPPAVSSSLNSDAVTVVRDSSQDTTRLPATPTGSTGSLLPGQAFGRRYRILKMLGMGGMGAVYEAWDADVNEAVALKVIRPDALGDPAAAQEIERRFKLELVLARQVTHKNVIRIHDIGEVDGVRYLTMPFLSGEDLSTLLRREGRLPLPRVLAIAKQVARGLAAAHEVGVVHRDLKPANIMIETDGTAVIMDFGIARSAAADGRGTRLGSVVGTLEYMAPEQAQGHPVDQRADIYAFGLVLYDLLTDRSRTKQHETPMSELMDRLTKPMTPVRTAATGIPAPVASVIDRCLQTDPAARYQITTALLHDLEALDEDGHVSVVAAPWFTVKRVAGLAALALVIVAAAVGGSWLLFQRRGPAAPMRPDPVSVLIADFQNKANEPLFDGLLEQALGVGLEGASFVTLYPRRDAIRLAAQMSPGARLDSEHAALVAVREGVMRVVTGSIELQSSRYTLTAQGVDPANSKVLFSLETESGSKDKVLDAVGQMAAKVRRALGDRSVADEAVSGKETFTAGSLEAAHAYARGQELQWAGKFEEALASYQKAVRLDPTLGRAYAGMGAVSNNLGRRQEAEEYYKLALQHLDRMTDREKYRTRGGYYLLVRNNEKGREEALALIEKFPADTAALANLAVAELYRRDMKRSVELGKQALVAMPRNVIRANNLALFLMYAGDFPAAELQAKAVLSINREFAKAYVAMALSQAATGRVEDAERTYRSLVALPGAAPYYAASGLADLHMYQGRLKQAATELEQAAAAESKGSASRHARLLVTLAEVRALQGRPREAVDLAKQAMARSTDEGVLFLAAWVLAGAGQAAAAEAAAAALNEHLETEQQICARVVEGEIALSKAAAREAVTKFQAAQKIADTWLGRFGLARAYLAAGSPAEADSEVDICLKRQGEATAVLLDDVPSIRLVAQLHYYQGRVREALKNAGAAESYKTFLAIKAKGDEQGLVAEARRRLGSR